MTSRSSYSLQRTMIIYILLIGFAALLVASEFVLDTHSASLKQALTQNFQQFANGDIDREQIYEPLVRIRNKAMMMVGVILAVVVIVLTMFIKTITEPLQHMVEVSKAISTGDLSQTTRVDTRNELSQLSAAIDDMSTNLQEIISDLGSRLQKGPEQRRKAYCGNHHNKSKAQENTDCAVTCKISGPYRMVISGETNCQEPKNKKSENEPA